MRIIKTSLLSLVLLTAFLIIVSQTVNANTIDNGDFETGSLLPWTGHLNLQYGTNSYNPQIVISTTDKYSGTYSAYFESSFGDHYENAEIIIDNFDASSYVNLSVMAKASSSSSSVPRVWAYLTDNGATTNTHYLYSDTDGMWSVPKDGAWHKYDSNYDPDATGLHRLHIEIWTTGTWTNAKCYIDDIKINNESFVNTPIANFTGTPTVGYSPLNVQFNSTSTNNPALWAWNFGDGTSNSSLENPVHQYTEPGVYNVTLTATNNAGSSSITKANYITVDLQESSYNNGFRIIAYPDNFGNGTYPVQAVFANLIPSANYTLFDKVVWKLDGSVISDSDVANGWVNVKESRYNVDHWETYWPQYADDWQDVTRATVLNNTIHFKTAGSHTVTALAYYGGVQIADVSAVVTVAEFGSLSSNYIAVLDISDDSLVDGATVQFTDNMTGETTTITSSTYSDYVTLTKGHLYSVGVIKSGYATYNSTLLWPDTTGASIPIKITPNGMATPGGQVYVNFHVTSAATGQPIAQTYVLVKYPGYSAVWPIGSDGYVSVPVDQSVTVVYTIFHATEQYYRINSSVAITSSSVNIEKKLTTKTATINPATPTPIPTAATTPTPIPGTSYTPYTDTQREETMFETFDMLLGAAPALVGLCIVCTIMGLMDKMRPRRR